jgi:cell division protease FtsH
MDITMVTNLARTMVIEWGMSEKLGFVRYAGADTREMFTPDKDYSDQTAQTIDAEIKRLVDEAYTDAVRLLEEHWEKVVAVAEALLRYETLSSDDVDRLMKGGTITKPTVSDLLRAEAARKREAAQPATTPDPEPPAGALPSPA